MMVAVQASGRMVMSIGVFLYAADQHVVVDDRLNFRIVDRGRQFGGVVGVNDHDFVVGGNVGDDRGLFKAPMLQHEGGFGVRFAQKHRLCRGVFDFG